MKARTNSYCCIRLLCLSIFLLLIIHPNSKAQHILLGNEKLSAEVGLNFGPSFFLGDLGGHRGYGTTFIKDLNLPLTHFMEGAFISIYPTKWIGLRLAGQLTGLQGEDKIINTNGNYETFRKDRNLDFKTKVSEAYMAIEFFPFLYLKRNDETNSPRTMLYVFAGLGIFHFNPQGSITDANGDVSWHNLQALHLEGQGFAEYPERHNYALTQLNIPMGAGIKFLVSKKMTLATEVLYRKTFTDYIDDVSTTYIDPNLFDKYLSVADAALARRINDKAPTGGITLTAPGYQRGNPKNNDTYFSFVLKLGIRLRSAYNNDFDRGATNQTRCPKRF